MRKGIVVVWSNGISDAIWQRIKIPEKILDMIYLISKNYN